jgi:hypothetical protein
MAPRYSISSGGINAFNRLLTERKQGLPISEVLREQAETHGRLVDFIQGAPEELLVRERRFRHRLRMDAYGHYPKHSEAIRNAARCVFGVRVLLGGCWRRTSGVRRVEARIYEHGVALLDSPASYACSRATNISKTGPSNRRSLHYATLRSG